MKKTIACAFFALLCIAIVVNILPGSRQQLTKEQLERELLMVDLVAFINNRKLNHINETLDEGLEAFNIRLGIQAELKGVEFHKIPENIQSGYLVGVSYYVYDDKLKFGVLADGFRVGHTFDADFLQRANLYFQISQFYY